MNSKGHVPADNNAPCTEKRLTKGQERIVKQALNILQSTLQKNAVPLISAEAVRHYLKLQLANKLNEIFVCLYLDNRHRLIAYREVFFGTIDGAAVYPRVIAQQVLQYNAAAVIFAHNHPSGVAEPSESDKQITHRLIDALNLIEVRVLDHWIIAGQDTVSFSERGIL